MFNYDGTEFLVAIQSKTDGDAPTKALNDVAEMYSELSEADIAKMLLWQDEDE